MKKILILIALTSCELIKLNSPKVSDSSAEKQDIVKPNIPEDSGIDAEKQEEQKKMNLLWNTKLKSMDNYRIEYSDKNGLEIQKIEIAENGDFEISAHPYKFISAVSDSKAHYCLANADSDKKIILEIKTTNPDEDFTQLLASDPNFNSQINKYGEVVKGTFSFNYQNIVLYRSVPNGK